MDWAIFWAIFSQIHLVTLLAMHSLESSCTCLLRVSLGNVPRTIFKRFLTFRSSVKANLIFLWSSCPFYPNAKSDIKINYLLQFKFIFLKRALLLNVEGCCSETFQQKFSVRNRLEFGNVCSIPIIAWTPLTQNARVIPRKQSLVYFLSFSSRTLDKYVPQNHFQNSGIRVYYLIHI
jgi:hypothetical protein